MVPLFLEPFSDYKYPFTNQIAIIIIIVIIWSRFLGLWVLHVFKKTLFDFSQSATLSKLKIACLESQKKEAKLRYQEQLSHYVKACLGTPMDKLHVSNRKYQQYM